MLKLMERNKRIIIEEGFLKNIENDENKIEMKNKNKFDNLSF